MVDFVTLTGGIKTAFDLARSAKDVNDQARANAAVIGIMEQLMEVQSHLSATQVEYQALIEEVARLKSELDDKRRFDDYRLERTPMGGYIFTLKEECVTDDRPPHSICPRCKEDGRLSPLSESSYRFDCPACPFVAGKKPRPPRNKRSVVHPGFT
jgi:Zn ribbon nucleic-acid-binding protein